MASITLPRIPSFTSVDLPTLDMSALKDAAYITVGLAVLTAQKTQVRRQELKKSLATQVGDGRSQMAELVEGVEAGIAAIDQRLVVVGAKVDAAVEELEKRLPARAGALLGQAHEVAKVARQQVRNLVVPAV